MAEESGWEGNFTVHNFLYLFNFAPCEFVPYSKIYRFKGFFNSLPCFSHFLKLAVLMSL